MTTNNESPAVQALSDDLILKIAAETGIYRNTQTGWIADICKLNPFARAIEAKVRSAAPVMADRNAVLEEAALTCWNPMADHRSAFDRGLGDYAEGGEAAHKSDAAAIRNLKDVAPASAPQMRKATTELSLKEIAAELHACAELGADYVISPGACSKLFDAMTTPPTAKLEDSKFIAEAAKAGIFCTMPQAVAFGRKIESATRALADSVPVGAKNQEPAAPAQQPLATNAARLHERENAMWHVFVAMQNGLSAGGFQGSVDAGLEKLASEIALAASPVAALPDAPSEIDKLDAARWRALLASQRIRMIGSAGIKKPEPNHYAHFGMEIWTTYSRDYSAELLLQLDSGNAQGREWLTLYADIAIEAQSASIAAEPVTQEKK